MPFQVGRDPKGKVERDFDISDRESTRSISRRRRNRAQSHTVDDRVRKEGGGAGVRKHIHNQDKVLRTFGARKGIHVRYVGDGVGNGARPGDVIRHFEDFL